MPYLFAYFRHIYNDIIDVTAAGVVSLPNRAGSVQQETLHLAFSHDAINWTPLQGNESVLPGLFVRDPFIGRGPDGRFHLVATGGGKKDNFQYASSRNLIDWETFRAPSVMAGVAGAANVWAPEWVWDDAQRNYFVYWSTSHGEHGWDDSRIWCARTTDFATFTAPRVLFDPGYTVIDATIVPHAGTYYMFVKDERFGYRHGEHRFVNVATATALDGPYSIVAEAITPERTEGPAVLKRDGRYLLFCDDCYNNTYRASVSDDLLHWAPIDADFPADARHGSVLPITEEELSDLRSRLGTS